MENLKQNLELLYELQDYDIKIEKIKENVENSPVLIEEKEKDLQEKKATAEAEKKHFVELNSIKKEKEALLDSKEKLIDKHSLELNSIKSNDTYKAMLLEIEKAKADKSVIEDEILELMEKIDIESAVIKQAEADFKVFEQKTNAEIEEIKNSSKKSEDEIAKLEKEREEHKQKVDKNILEQYERIREGRNGQGICFIDGESCGGCGMVLRPQLINQAYKYTELVYCDNCSRILMKKP